MTGIEIAAVAAFIGALKNLKDLTASLGDKVPQQVHDQILEISERFSSIQVQLLAAQQQAIELTERCQKLQDELNRMNEWLAQKARYSLRKVGEKQYVYGLKPDRQEDEPEHWLCTSCFQAQRISILQGLTGSGKFLTCVRCEYALDLRDASDRSVF